MKTAVETHLTEMYWTWPPDRHLTIYKTLNQFRHLLSKRAIRNDISRNGIPIYPWMLKTRTEIEHWVQQVEKRRLPPQTNTDSRPYQPFHVNRDLSVDWIGDVVITRQDVVPVLVSPNSLSCLYVWNNNSNELFQSYQQTSPISDQIPFEQKQIKQGNALPVNFRIVTGNFYCIDVGLTSLVNVPRVVGRSFNCQCNKIDSLNDGPIVVGTDYLCHDNPITSLKNIHKSIKAINRDFSIPQSITSNIIGTMKINNLKRIMINNIDNMSGNLIPSYMTSPFSSLAAFGISNIKLERAVSIINNHLHSERNIHQCQHELIELGLVAYANL